MSCFKQASTSLLKANLTNPFINVSYRLSLNMELFSYNLTWGTIVVFFSRSFGLQRKGVIRHGYNKKNQIYYRIVFGFNNRVRIEDVKFDDILAISIPYTISSMPYLGETTSYNGNIACVKKFEGSFARNDVTVTITSQISFKSISNNYNNERYDKNYHSTLITPNRCNASVFGVNSIKLGSKKGKHASQLPQNITDSPDRCVSAVPHRISAERIRELKWGSIVFYYSRKYACKLKGVIRYGYVDNNNQICYGTIFKINGYCKKDMVQYGDIIDIRVPSQVENAPYLGEPAYYKGNLGHVQKFEENASFCGVDVTITCQIKM